MFIYEKNHLKATPRHGDRSAKAGLGGFAISDVNVGLWLLKSDGFDHDVKSGFNFQRFKGVFNEGSF